MFHGVVQLSCSIFFPVVFSRSFPGFHGKNQIFPRFPGPVSVAWPAQDSPPPSVAASPGVWRSNPLGKRKIFMAENADFMRKAGDFMMNNCDLMMKQCDFERENGDVTAEDRRCNGISWDIP